MANLPAICDSCGTVFKSGSSFSGGGTVVSIGSSSGPCPNCGGMGNIVNGTYKIVENIIGVLSATERNLDELKKLADTLETAQKSNYSKEKLEKQMEKDIPGISSIIDLLPKTREEKRSDLHFVITTILAVLAIAIPLINNGAKDNVEEIKTEQVIQNIYNIENQTIVNYPQQTTRKMQNIQEPVKLEKIGRNEPCPCGSGIKYKKCHGK